MKNSVYKITQRKKKRKLRVEKATVFFLCIIVLGFILLLLFYLSQIFSLSFHKPSIKNSSSFLNEKNLSQKEYEAIDTSLAAIVEEQDPKAALSHLQSLMNSDPRILKSCHGFVHDIGHAAFLKYGNFSNAMTYQDDLCGSGYLHGVIEQDFATSKDFFSTIDSLCAGYTKPSGKCYHGVGHGFMYYTQNNVPLSIYYCSAYVPKESQIYCSEGVFMENFNSEERFHPSKYLKPSDPFYPCNEQTQFYKDSCYFYAPDYYLQLHEGDYADAIKWCNTAEKGFINKCFNGLGSRTMKQNINNPKFVESVCLQSDDSIKTAACIDGMISYYLVNYNSIEKTKNLCTTLEKEDTLSCNRAISSRNNIFSVQ